MRRALILLAAAALLGLGWVALARAAAPAPTLTVPADGSATNDTTPTFSGGGGTAAGDSATVTLNVYAGSTASGSPVQSLPATVGAGGAWSVDATPALAEGTYTAQAEQANGPDTGTSAPHTFTVDATKPAVTVVSPADGSATNDTTPLLSGAAGTASGDSPTITVNIYSGPTATGTPQVLTTNGSSGSWGVTATLAPGTYTVQAQQSDSAGNTGVTPAQTFTVDTTPPDTSITSGPGGTASSTSATFTFSANEPATFACRLDGGAFVPCSSPTTYSGLAPGSHAFEVRATDRAGNTDTSSAFASWQIEAPQAPSNGQADKTAAPPSAAPAAAPAAAPPSLMSPFPIVRIAGRLTKTGVSLTAFEVVVAPGARIEVSCRGRSCPLRRQTRSASPRARTASRVRFTRFGRLRAGVVLEVRVTKAGTIGKYTRFVIRRKKLPSRSDACLMPGRSAPVGCPS